MSEITKEITDEIIRENLKILIEYEIKYYGVTRSQIAACLFPHYTVGSQKTTLSQIESGKKPIYQDIIDSICEYFNIPEFVLLGEKITEEILKGLNQPISEQFFSTMFDSYSMVFPVILSPQLNDSPNLEKRIEELNKINTFDSYPTPIRFHECKSYFYKQLEDNSNISAASYLLQVLFIEYIFFVIKEKELLYLSNRMCRGSLKTYECLSFFEKKLQISAEYAAYFLSQNSSYINKCLDVLGKDPAGKDLAYYYIALKYIYGMCSVPDKLEEKREIGLELMEALRTLHNPYAEKYLESQKDISLY